MRTIILRASALGIVAALSAGTSGCIGKQYHVPNYQSSIHQQNPGRRVLLLPLRTMSGVAQAPAADLVAADAAVGAYLSEHGYQLQRSAEVEQLVASFGDPRNLLYPTTKLFEALQTRDDCDYVMAPVVTLRQAELKGSDARWDGVIRPIPTEGAASALTWSGYQKATSLSVLVFTRKGEVVLASLGGLEVAFTMTLGVRYESPGTSPGSPLAQTSAGANARTGYLANPEYLREAIALALHPFIAMRDYPEDPEPYRGPGG